MDIIRSRNNPNWPQSLQSSTQHRRPISSQEINVLLTAMHFEETICFIHLGSSEADMKSDTAVILEKMEKTMSVIIRSGAGMSAPTNTKFSNVLPELAGTFPEALDFEVRPLMVLRVAGESEESQGYSEIWRSDLATLCAVIRSLGFEPDQANLFDLSRYPGEFHFPRNFSWSALPVVLPPQHKEKYPVIVPLSSEGRSRPSEQDSVRFAVPFRSWEFGSFESNIFVGVKAVIIQSRECSDDVIRAATMHFDRHAEGLMPRFVYHGPDGVREISREEVLDVRSKFAAEERFVFNHAINLSVLGGRAYYKILHEMQLPRSFAARVVPKLDFLSWEWTHPLIIQTMYLMKRIGLVSPSAGLPISNSDISAFNVSVDYHQRGYLLATRLPIFARDGDLFRLEWKGSGKYPSWSMDVGVVHDRAAFVPKDGIMPTEHHIFRCFGSLFSMGLLEVSEDSLLLSKVGVRFLEMLGPDLDDEDVLLRWRPLGKRLGSPDDIPAMDRWLNRAFRSVKRRVSSLPSTPFIENGGEDIEVNGNPGNLMVRGLVIPVLPDDLKSPEIADFVNSLKASEGSILDRDRRCGIVMSPDCLGKSREILGVWTGIPLGVFDRADIYQKRVDLFRDMTAIDENSLAARSLLPKALSERVSKAKPRTLQVGEISAPFERFVDLPSALPSDAGPIRDIVQGRVIELSELSSAPSDIRPLLEGMKRFREALKAQETDGLRVYGDLDGKFIVSFGFLCGQETEDSTNRFMRRILPRSYIKNFAQRQEQFWKVHPDFGRDARTSVEGFWSIALDGSVRPLSTPKETKADPHSPIGTEDNGIASQGVSSQDVVDINPSSPSKGDFIKASLGPAVSGDEKKKLSSEENSSDDSNPPISARHHRNRIFTQIYREEWLRAFDPSGLVRALADSPMRIAAATCVPDDHHSYLTFDHPSSSALVLLSNTKSESKHTKKGSGQKTEAEYSKELRDLVTNGNSVMFVTEKGGIPGVYDANGPVIRPTHNAFAVAARTFLRCEKALADAGLDPVVVEGGATDDLSLSEVFGEDGSLFAGGERHAIHLSAKFTAAVHRYVKRAVVDGNLRLSDFLSMAEWDNMARIRGVSSGSGPSSLAEIPGIGRVRKRLQSLRHKMAGDGSKVGVILHGPPGTGKTMLARAFARDTARHFVLGSFAEWQSSGEGHLGTTLAAMRASFEEAKNNQPALLFVDEIDSLGSRDQKQTDYMKIVVNAFLELLQGFNGRGDVVVVSATNHLAKLDPAIVRSGRLGDHVRIDLPNRSEMVEIVAWYACSHRLLGISDTDIGRLADLFLGSSPADVEAVFEEGRCLSESEGAVFDISIINRVIEAALASKNFVGDVADYFVLHEVSRFVSLHLLGKISNVTCVRSTPGFSHEGGVVFHDDTAPGMSKDKANDLLALLSGLAAATITDDGDVDVGRIAGFCINQARKVASDLVHLGLSPGNKVCFVPLSDDAAVDVAATEWLSWAHGKAVEMLKPYFESGLVPSLCRKLKQVGVLYPEDMSGFSAEQ